MPWQAFRNAAKSKGISQKITKNAGARQPEVRNVVFKIPGGTRGLGAEQEREHMVFRPTSSGKEGLAKDGMEPAKPMTPKAVNDALKVCERSLPEKGLASNGVCLRGCLAILWGATLIREGK